MRRFITYMLIAGVIVSVTGCSGSWRRKFVRKKKDEVKQGPVLQPYDYKKEFTNKQLYANHYVFWKNSEAELINSVRSKANMKKIESQSAYSLVEIRKLADLLAGEKKALLEPYIEELQDIVNKIGQPNYVSSNSNRIVSELKRHYRAVCGRFSYFHMKNFVRPDTEEAESEESPAAE